MAERKDKLAEMRRLDAEGSPAPWRSMRDGNQYLKTSYLPCAKCVGASRIEGVSRPWNPHAYVSFGFKPEEFETVRFTDADADLVAAMRNNFAKLLTVVDAANETERVFRLGSHVGCQPADDALRELRAALAALGEP